MSDDLSIPSQTYRVPRHHRRGGLDPAFQRLLVYAGGLVAVGVVIGGVSMLFNRHSGPVPVLQADPRPLRVKPENPGGMQIAGINADPANDGDGVGKLAPAPEVPDPKALRAPPAPPPQPHAAALPAPAGPPAATAQAPVARTAAVQAPPAAAKPAPTPAPAPVVAHAAAAKPAPGTKSAAVQLAALSSEDAAKLEWQRMEHRLPELLANRSPSVSKIEHDGRTYWRLRVAGFGDVTQAKAFCERARAKGASCTVADF